MNLVAEALKGTGRNAREIAEMGKSKKKDKQKKGKAKYWTAGKKGATVFTDGRWIHIELPKGQKVRVEVTDVLRAQLTSAGTAGSGRDAHLDDIYKTRGKKDEGPVPFETFDYDDLEAECEVYDMDSGWQNVPRQAPAGGGGLRLKKVTATRVKKNGVVVATGHPAPMPGSFIRSCSGSALSLSNVIHGSA